jgi:hypothetical protein
MHTIMMFNQNSIVIIWLLCIASTASVSDFGLFDLRDPGDQTCSGPFPLPPVPSVTLTLLQTGESASPSTAMCAAQEQPANQTAACSPPASAAKTAISATKDSSAPTPIRIPTTTWTGAM